MATNMLQRYSSHERMNHWMVVALFALAALSGFAFFYPWLYFLSAIFGGGELARTLHPFFGVVMVLSFSGLFFRLRADNAIGEADKAWAANMGEMVKGNKEAMPPVGKYNYGQKMVFWVTSICLLTLLVTGVMFWSPWFAPSFPIGLQRVAVLLHAVAAVGLVLTIFAHAYAAFWVKGTMRAMTEGVVSEGWAKANHPLWYKEVAKK
jgi:formate dehydrogenase subunit gamma